MLPPSTNADYRGAPLAAHFLTFIGVATIVPGLIHAFLPDGGAGVIAGMDLTGGGAALIGVFAWAGATQIAWGAALLAASRRYRSLVPPLLALVLVERSLIAANLWLLKPPPSGHRPPEAYATLVALPLIAAALALALRRRGRAQFGQYT
ncbi:MAG: hypothetical protein DCC71_07045 [Proteobacteria bacterium]|nr:MAG: hypothetical protein DCC71_07045 [Pseudomonadota bacterium]